MPGLGSMTSLSQSFLKRFFIAGSPIRQIVGAKSTVCAVSLATEKSMADQLDSDEYVPDLGTNPATVQMYDSYFVGTKGALLKTRIEDAAQRVGLNPGLLAASLFAEFSPGSYTKTSGEVDGWDIGTDDYKERKTDIERKIAAAKDLKPLRYEPARNEQGRDIAEVPVFKAKDAVLASAIYLKYAELEVRRAM